MMQIKQLLLTWITTTHCPAFRTNKSTQTSSETWQCGFWQFTIRLCCTSSETDAREWDSLTYYNSPIHPVVKLVSDTVQQWSKTTTMRHPARKRSSIWYSGLTNLDLNNKKYRNDTWLQEMVGGALWPLHTWSGDRKDEPLHIHILTDLAWTRNISHQAEKASQRLLLPQEAEAGSVNTHW